MEFTLECLLPASPEQVYDMWLNSDGHSSMTGSEANCSAELGASFNPWDGYIWGKNKELEPKARIVQSWRTSEFDDANPDSEVEILFKNEEGETRLILHHRNLQEGDTQYITGWKEHYFVPMLEYLSPNF